MRSAAVALIVTVLAFSASAAPHVTQTVTLPQVIQGVLQQHPDLAGIERDAADRLADALATTARDNPEVQLDVMRAASGGAASTALEVTQPLKSSSWTSRPGYAAALRTQASVAQQAAVFAVLNTVTAQYAQVWLLQERQQYLRQIIAQADSVLAVARTASVRGELPAAELSILEAQNAELEQQLLRLEADFDSLAATLARVSGIPGITQVAPPGFAAIPADSARILAAAHRNTSARAVLQSQLAAANARLQVAQDDAAYPEFAPRLMWDRNGEDREDELGIGVAVRIPLWNRNEAEITRARADVAASRQALDRLQLEEQLTSKHKRVLALAQQEQAYQKTILPKYQASYDLTEKMFRSGQTSLLTVWQVQREMLSVQEKALEISADALTARLDLEAAMGAKIEEIR